MEKRPKETTSTRTVEVTGQMTSWDDAGRWETRGSLVLVIEPDDAGGHVASVHARLGYQDRHDPLASVAFSTDRSASAAMGELVEALGEAGVVYVSSANPVTATRLMTALPDGDLPAAADVLIAVRPEANLHSG